MDEDTLVTLMKTLVEAGEEAAARPLEEAVLHVQCRVDAVAAELGDGLKPDEPALLHWVVRGALAPRTLSRAHLQPLRDRGWSDLALHDAVHVVACFSYMNRLADMLGVGVASPERLALAERIYGVEAVAGHARWANLEADPAGPDAPDAPDAPDTPDSPASTERSDPKP